MARAYKYFNVELESRANGLQASFALRNYIKLLHNNQNMLQEYLERIPTNILTQEIDLNLKIQNFRKIDGDSRIIRWLQKAGETPADRMARITRVMLRVAVRCKRLLQKIRDRKRKEVEEEEEED